MIFISVSLPLTGFAVDTLFDSSNSIMIKSEVVKIASSIDQVYSNGPGSKRTVLLDFPEENTINFIKNQETGGIAISRILLSDSSQKEIEIPYKANNCQSSISFSKGFNKIEIHWVYGEKDIRINKI